MNQQQNTRKQVPPPRQGKLDLSMSDRWQQLPESDRQACRQALAQLLYQVVTSQSGDQHDER
jgi:hypothetical protein